ncbi:MAG: AAA family ATPase [Elusimicrobia bacterium]|nr:AAA family ATPase [Elusimicrobiota bacterium]
MSPSGKFLRGLLCAALLIASPGSLPYQALAASRPEGRPVSAAQLRLAMRAVTRVGKGPADSSRASRAQRRLAGRLSSLDLDSAQGRALAERFAQRVEGLGPEASESELAQALIAAAEQSSEPLQPGFGGFEGVGRHIAAVIRSWRKAVPAEIEAANSAGVSAARSPQALARPSFSPREPGVIEPVAVERHSLGTHAQPRAFWSGRLGRAALWGAALALAGAAIAHLGLIPAAALSAVLIGSVLLHEVEHLRVLRKLGDPTAEKHGHGSLNPLKHIDPWKTLALPLLTLLGSLLWLPAPVIFGQAAPVRVDFNKLPDPKRDAARVAWAGPRTNLLLSAAAWAAYLALPGLGLIAAGGSAAWVLWQAAAINASLALFNLLPLPNLDGGKILVRYLPQRVYRLWTSNPDLPASYQSTYQRLYEGPAYLLSKLGIASQGRVNRLAWGASVLSLALFSVGLSAWLGAPLALFLLVCAYDYYCIREKIQNEEAVKAIIGIFQGFSRAMAQAAERDEGVESEINSEEVEHVLKNAFEDTLDKIMDSEGFEALDEAGRWERFESAYREAAVAALRAHGMSEDGPEAIRRFLDRADLKSYFQALRDWMTRYEAWEKWRSPKRRQRRRDAEGKSSQAQGGAATAMGLAVLGAFGVGLAGIDLGAVALLPGTVEPNAPAARPSFVQALNDANLKFDDKQKAFLTLHLTELKLKKVAPVIGRVEEIKRLIKSARGPRGVINNVVAWGKTGVGKTALFEGLAQAQAFSETQPEGGTFKLASLEGRYLLELDLSRLMLADDPAMALAMIFQYLARFNDPDPRNGSKVILIIDEIHKLFKHPRGELMAELLKRHLREGDLAVFAATTEAEYRKYIEPDEAFSRRLVPLELKPATPEETLLYLEGGQEYYERLFGVTIAPEALRALAELSRFDRSVELPERAFKYLRLASSEANFDSRRDRYSLDIRDLIGRLRYAMQRLSEQLSGSELVTDKLKKDEPGAISLYNLAIDLSQELIDLYRKRDGVPTEGTPVVDSEMVKEEISRETGIKSGLLVSGEEDLERYLKMEEIVGRRVIGQEEPIHIIAEAVRQNKAGLSDPNRPMGVFYLTGPTGSGKTLLAKTLAWFLFGDPEAMVRVDMSEYQEGHSVSRGIGAPPGYVGHEQGGQWTEKVRRRPYSVVLFDEIEKAHPNVWLLLLPLLADGRMTDGQGRTVDFKNTLILMTSNLGMQAVNVEPYVKAYQAMRTDIQAAEAAGDAHALQAARSRLEQLIANLSADTKKTTMEVTGKYFKEVYPPEFQGRLHAPPIVFNRITPAMAREIVELNLKQLREVLAFAGHEFDWDPGLVAHIVDEGYSIELGARPLQNAIDRLVTRPIAKEILKAAVASGNKIRPSEIKVGFEQGRVGFEIKALKPRPLAKKKSREAAARELFMRVLRHSLAAAVQPIAAPGLSEIDAWARAALGQDPVRAQEPGSGAPAAEPPGDGALFSAKPGGMRAMGDSQITVLASHNRPQGKDEGLRRLREELSAALEREGYPESVRELILRTVEHPDDPYVGWLKLMVERAKERQTGESPIKISYEVDGDSVRLLVHREGELDARETAVFETHFRGPPPESPSVSRERAEAANVAGEDGRRHYFDLYRALNRMGANWGYFSGILARGESGVDYWIEIPKVPPQPAAAPAGEAAARGQPDTGKIKEHARERDIGAYGFDPAWAGIVLTLGRREYRGWDGYLSELKSRFHLRETLSIHGGHDTKFGLVLERRPSGDEALEEELARLAIELSREEAAVSIAVDRRVAKRIAAPQPPALLAKVDLLPDELRPAAEARRTILIELAHQGFPTQYFRDNLFVSINRGVGLMLVRDSRTGSRLEAEFRADDPEAAARAVIALADYGALDAIRVHPEVKRRIAELLRDPSAPARERPDRSPREQLKAMALAILRQGNQRSPSVLIAAGDLFASLASSDDLNLALDWIGHNDSRLQHFLIGAGAAVVAALGQGEDKLEVLSQAMESLSRRGGDEFKPIKSRLADAYAEIAARSLDPGEIRRRFEEESGKRAVEGRNEPLISALYTALARRAGAEAQPVLLENWEQPRGRELYQYLKRAEPALLREIYEDWKRIRARPDGAARQLVLYAIADHGDRDDLEALKGIAESGWEGALEHQGKLMAAEAYAAMVKRLGAFASVRNESRTWISGGLGDSINFSRMVSAVEVIGEAGSARDMPLLERLMELNPAQVNAAHEMTQQLAARAWARRAIALGLMGGLMSAEPGPDHVDQPSRIAKMLTDTNPIVNTAALEALRLHFQARPGGS